MSLLMLFLAACGIDNELTSLQEAPRVIVRDGQVTETFVQPDNTKADILFVIDNSGSMSDEQVQLTSNVAPLMDEILTKSIEEDLDFHVGVVSTDMDNLEESGRLQSYYCGISDDGLEQYAKYISKDLIEECYGVNAENDLATYTLDAEDAFSDLVLGLGTWGSGSEMGRDAAYIGLTGHGDFDADGNGTIGANESAVRIRDSEDPMRISRL